MTAVLSQPMFLQFFNPLGLGFLSGGKLFTYISGTATKTNTWTDSTQGVLNSNPIILDSQGACYVWLDPTITYKFVLAPSSDTDPPVSAYRTVDNIAAGLTSAVPTQAFLGSILYPRTAAEIAAGVTPTSYAYKPDVEIDGRRYGFNGDGVTLNDTPIASAIAVLTVLGGGLLRLPGGTFKFATGFSQPIGVVIAGESYHSTILKYSGSSVAITIPANISQCGLRDLQLQGTAKAGTGLQLGTTDFCDLNFFERVYINTFAVGVRFGATFSNSFRDCRISGNTVGVDFNASFASGATNATSFSGCYISSNDRNGVDASNVPVRNTAIAFYNTTIENNCSSAPSTYPQFYMGSVQNFTLSSCYLEYTLGGTPPDAIKANGLSNGRIDACFFNVYANAIKDTAGTSVSDVTISNCRALGGTVKSIDLTTETRVVIEMTCLWDTTVTLTGTDCKLYTKPAAEQLVTDSTFTPTLIGSTTAGAQTYTQQVGFYSQIGNQVSFYGRVSISAKGGTIAGNAQVGGLPVACVNHSQGNFIVKFLCSGVTHAGGYTEFAGMLSPGTTLIDVMEEGSGVGEANVPVANIAAATTIRFTGSYTV